MRLLLVGAFPYPQSHGSQIYFQEQAIALRSLGVEISLLTYGAGKKLRPAAEDAEDDDNPETENRGKREIEVAEHWRALDGFEHLRSPEWTAPSSLRSGPSWAKPLADLGLAMTLRNALASESRHGAYDAILTHNAEATLCALKVLPRRRPPILYCAHTLLAKELPTYLKESKSKAFLNQTSLTPTIGRVAKVLDRFGHRIDRALAENAEGWIALTRSSERFMRHFSNAPGMLIPPAVPDPLTGCLALEPARTARRYGLEPGRFLLYSGNLDAYQELDILAAVAGKRTRGNRAGGHPALRLVIASHAPRKDAGSNDAIPGVEFLHVESSAEMQALLASARASLLMRRAEGGFPIKLVNSLASRTPVIAFHGQEWGLEHERNGLICSPARPVESMVAAIDRLERDDGLTARLATGARELYLRRHRPEPAARRVLELVEEVRRSHARL
jgi:glycosyltransferase involved in cell wall biosynthesis